MSQPHKPDSATSNSLSARGLDRFIPQKEFGTFQASPVASSAESRNFTFRLASRPEVDRQLPPMPSIMMARTPFPGSTKSTAIVLEDDSDDELADEDLVWPHPPTAKSEDGTRTHREHSS